MSIGIRIATSGEQNDLPIAGSAATADSATDLAFDDEVYDEIETLIRDDLPRQGCVELAQALEDVMKLLRAATSEFSDPRSGCVPMVAAGIPK